MKDNEDSNLILYFISEFGQEKTAEAVAPLKVSDQSLQNLVEKIVKFTLCLDIGLSTSSASIHKVIEKFSPGSIAQINQRQARHEVKNPNQDVLYQQFSKLSDGDGASVEELLSQAEKFPRSYRAQIYRRAAGKTATSGNIADAKKIITENFSEEESESYLSQLNYNLAMQAINEGKFNEANQLINQMSEENSRLNALIYLATAIYQKNPKENQKWATTVLDQARSLISETPEKTSEINSLANLALVYVETEPTQAFRILESLVSPMNELSEAAAVVAKFNDYGNLRRGEYPVNAMNNPLGVNNLASVLQKLKDKDFDRVIQFVNGFSRLDARISLEMQIIGLNFLFNSSSRNSFYYRSWRNQDLIIDKQHQF